MKACLCTIYVAIFLLFAAGCRKEYSFEYTPANTLKDAQGVCLPSEIHGSFFKNTNLDNDTAYLELQVNVAVTGSYFGQQAFDLVRMTKASLEASMFRR